MAQLNKKKCRRFALSNLRIDARQGIFSAKQIGYVIRTAVKNIGRSRTLILYIYDRARAACGDAVPAWTVFQTKDGYITLARREDGSTRWRTAAFERLDGEYDFPSKCAFYTSGDERRLCRFFHAEDGSGFAPLIAAQEKIQERRRKARAEQRDRRILQRMAGIPPLPKGVERWTRSIMPAYIFYSRKGRGQAAVGVCTSCCHEVTIDNARHNAKTVCPHCGRDVTIKSRGRRGRLYNRDTVQVIQRVSADEAVVRIVKVHYDYGHDLDMPTVSLIENARLFVRCDANGAIRTENYYDSYKDGGLTSWARGSRPRFSAWQYCYEADTCGFVYLQNLPGALRNTPFRYAPIAQFCSHFAGERIEMLPFLRAHLEHPRFEHLVKTGFFTLASDLAYRSYVDENLLDETQCRTHRILQIAAEDVAFLREMDVDMQTLKIFQGYAGLRDRQRLLRWQIGNGVTADMLEILGYMSIHRLICYVERQHGILSQTKDGGGRYKKMQDTVIEYRDYLNMRLKLGDNMKASAILYPKDLQKAHDSAALRVKQEADARIRRDFVSACKEAAGKLTFEKDGLMIFCPATPDDVTAEGRQLGHCVGNYISRVANRECLILFIRKISEKDKPFFTVEVRGQTAVQVRGSRNCEPTKEIQKFVEAWERQVLQAAA